jgi:ubiquinone/menaquinone biosynthesis C-methylase UbiE/uncharacterized protein YbaR (Trm112 family)
MAYNLKSILCCPGCLGSLITKGATSQCTQCDSNYRAIGGIPQLLTKTLSNDVSFSEGRWQSLHDKERLDRNISIDPTIQSYIRFISQYKKDISKGVFLDLGCGVARLSSVLASQGTRVVGVDISQNALKKTHTLFKKKHVCGTFVRGDLLALPFKDSSFSFVYSCMSLEYVKDTLWGIQEAYRVLKNRGTMVAILPVISLTTLTYHQLRGDIPGIPIIKPLMEFVHMRVLKGRYMNYGYEQSFTVKHLKNLFLRAGFKKIKVGYFDTHYPLLFLPSKIRTIAQNLLKYRLFWPLVYIEATK